MTCNKKINSGLLANLKDSGFTLIPNIANIDTIQNMIDALDVCIHAYENRAFNKPFFYQKHKAVNHTFDNPHFYNSTLARFADSLRSPLVSSFMKSPVLHMTLIQHNSYHEEVQHGIPWHQDIDSKIGPGKYYNFVFYPHDCTEEVGGLVVVPRSHLHGKIPPGQSYEPMEGMVTLYPKQGDLIIVDGCCFHCVPKNRSSIDRITFTTRFIEAEIEGEKSLRIGVYRTGKYDYDNQQDVYDE